MQIDLSDLKTVYNELFEKEFGIKIKKKQQNFNKKTLHNSQNVKLKKIETTPKHNKSSDKLVSSNFL